MIFNGWSLTSEFGLEEEENALSEEERLSKVTILLGEDKSEAFISPLLDLECLPSRAPDDKDEEYESKSDLNVLDLKPPLVGAWAVSCVALEDEDG